MCSMHNLINQIDSLLFHSMDEIDKDCSRLFKYNMQREFVQRNLCEFAAKGKTDRAEKTWDR
jgi:hypothetical protein